MVLQLSINTRARTRVRRPVLFIHGTEIFSAFGLDLKLLRYLLQSKPRNQREEEKEIITQSDPDWQASKSNMKERNAVMFNNELQADVHFIVGSGSIKQRIPAHKYILFTGSSVFYAMLCGGLTDDEKEISIPDVEPVAFLNLLRCV